MSRALSKRGLYPSNLNVVWQRTLTRWDREIDHLVSFGKNNELASSSKSTSSLTLEKYSSLISGSSPDRYWHIMTVSYRTTFWLKIRIIGSVPVLSVVAVNAIVCLVPLNRGNSKFQTTLLALSPLTQIHGTYLT